jgi:hypothetical protein
VIVVVLADAIAVGILLPRGGSSLAPLAAVDRDAEVS